MPVTRKSFMCVASARVMLKSVPPDSSAETKKASKICCSPRRVAAYYPVRGGKFISVWEYE